MRRINANKLYVSFVAGMLVLVGFAFMARTGDIASGYGISTDMKEIYRMSEDGGKEILVANDYDKFDLRVSPRRKMFGYFQALHLPGEYDEDSDSAAEEAYWNNYTGLFILGPRGENVPKEIYRGDNKVRAWEWVSDDRVIVYRSCGSPCDSYVIINTKGYILQKSTMLGLAHALSPDKQWVLGYAIWPGEIGVRVRNIDTQEEYAFIRTGGKHYHYAGYIKALWSDDAGVLAVLNKKKDEPHLEAALYDVKDDFRVLYKETVACELIGDDLRCDVPAPPEQFLAAVLARAP